MENIEEESLEKSTKYTRSSISRIQWKKPSCRLRQRWVEIAKSDLEKCAPG